MQIEHVAGIRLAAGAASEQQAERAVRHRVFGQVVVYDKRVAAGVHEILGHGAARVRRYVLHGRRIAGRSDDHRSIGERAVAAEGFHRLRHRTRLLSYRHVYARDVLVLLVEHGVHGYRRLTRLPAPVCASVPVRELFTDLQKLFPDETIHFELPPLEKTLDVDRAQIEQVLINLLKNAREASARRETPKIEVKAVFAPKVTSSLTAWRCTITVRDNGEGILPEVQDKIFVPFFTTKTAGSGIGLSLCKQIMNQHGGNITVYSEPGKGSCFTLQFC